MKALTIWQPWASLIMVGAKPFEFRGWRAPRSIVGQRIVIHAATRKIDWIDVETLFLILARRDRFPDSAARTCLHADPALDLLRRSLTDASVLPTGVGLGTAILGEPVIGTEVAERFGVSRANDSDRDAHANWGWPLTAIEVWPEPVPMRGAQGFWNWPAPQDVDL